MLVVQTECYHHFKCAGTASAATAAAAAAAEPLKSAGCVHQQV